MALQNVYPQKQASYLKDTTDFIKLSKALMVCETYEEFHNKNPPIATHFLREMLSLILKGNSLQRNGKDYL